MPKKILGGFAEELGGRKSTDEEDEEEEPEQPSVMSSLPFYKISSVIVRHLTNEISYHTECMRCNGEGHVYRDCPQYQFGNKKGELYLRIVKKVKIHRVRVRALGGHRSYLRFWQYY